MERVDRARAVILIVVVSASVVQAAQPAGQGSPGRRVTVAAIAIGCGGEHEKKLQMALEHLEAAGRRGVDIACLPEEFAGGKPDDAESIPGPTTQAVGAVAKKHRMYVVCPIRERAVDGRHYNTAVLLDREGKVAGRYRKVFPFWSESGVSPGDEGVPVFDTDFGRVALLTCFDANFDEAWQEAARKDAEIVLWPSAYGGGLPLAGYAMIHNYYVVAVGRGSMIDLFGRTIEPTTTPLPNLFIATLDLDLTVVHKDFNREKVAKLLAEQKGKVALLSEPGDMEGWFVLQAVAPGTRVRDLCRQYQIETLRDYRARSRREINTLRKANRPLP